MFRGRMFSASRHAYRSDKKGVIKIQMMKTVTKNDWSSYMKCCKAASSCATTFIDELVTPDNLLKIDFVAPCVAAVEKVSFPSFASKIGGLQRKPEKNEYVLIEQMIMGNIQSFVPSNPKILGPDLEYLEAFSHFTYWKSRGDLIVCDLKGVREENEFLFTCPTIHSKSKSYGPDDLGDEGIQTFFSRHECGKLCQPWLESARENPSAPSQPMVILPEISELSVESVIPPSRPDAYSPPAVGVTILGLFGDEVACPGEPVESETTWGNNSRLNVPDLPHRRRTLSDESGLPPPYSLVVRDPCRPRSNSCLPDLNTNYELSRNRHSSAPTDITNSSRSNYNDSPPTYESVAASLVAATVAAKSVHGDSRESLVLDTSRHASRTRRSGDSPPVVSGMHAYPTVQFQTSQSGTLVPSRGRQANRLTSRHLASDSVMETGYRWYAIPYTERASTNNSLASAPVRWSVAGETPTGDLVGRVLQIPLDAVFSETQLSSPPNHPPDSPSCYAIAPLDNHPLAMQIPQINIGYST